MQTLSRRHSQCVERAGRSAVAGEEKVQKCFAATDAALGQLRGVLAHCPSSSRGSGDRRLEVSGSMPLDSEAAAMAAAAAQTQLPLVEQRLSEEEQAMRSPVI